MLVLLEWLLAGVLGAAFALLALQNAEPVALKAYGFQVDAIPLYGVILLAGAIGAMPLILIGMVRSLRARFQLRRLRKEAAEQRARINELEEELLRLRAAA